MYSIKYFRPIKKLTYQTIYQGLIYDNPGRSSFPTQQQIVSEPSIEYLPNLRYR